MRVRPVLAKNCFGCHVGPTPTGNLAMTSRESFLKGGNSGPAIIAGDPDHSLLIQAVSHTHARLKMPPPGKLTDEEIADLAAWVKAGAEWPEATAGRITDSQRAFWSFQPVRKPAAPPVRDTSWAHTPIDRFVLARLQARGLRPNPPADKRTLIRRVSYDLIGLPPTPEEVDAFLKDNSREAFARVVDRLLASPHYGERWGRHWLDVARYSDDKLNSTQEEPVPNAFRYRDWVIQAFNQDMPYDLFVKAQVAGDLLPDSEKYIAGLGFYALRPEFQDDRVDATTRGFLGLTVACAQCHDHKFDPIPTKDYYSLLGVFQSTENREAPLAGAGVVAAWKAAKKRVDDQEAALKQFLQSQAEQLGEILAVKTARYLMAARQGVKEAEGLDAETIERWGKYLKVPNKEHPYLKAFDTAASDQEAQEAAEEFQALVLKVIQERKEIEEKNNITLGGSKERRNLANANLASLERDKYFLWRDLLSERRGNLSFQFEGGVLYYPDKRIERFLHGEWKAHLEDLRAQLAKRQKELPPQYPFLNAIQDSKKPANMRVHLRGNRDTPGEEAPRRFLAVLSRGEAKPFTRGSGRLELAEAIASRDNPLTARVMANRIWLEHFGQGIVGTPGNFGQLGERPHNPELLDYLAARLVENNWSIKALHREILLSAVYGLSPARSPRQEAVDPDNRLWWRANRRRLDAEAVRDSLLYVSGQLDVAQGGPAVRLTDENRRRSVYGYVSRRKLDSMLALFDFPNPNSISEQRIQTDVPLQRLFFLNSSLAARQAEALAARLGAGTDPEKIRRAYRFVHQRDPGRRETELGLEFLRAGREAWPLYCQILMSSNEFLFVD